MNNLKIALSVFFFSCSIHSTLAQVGNPYLYEDLSHRVGLRFRDSLKKNWQAPAIYKDKETQKKFKEFWDARTEFIVNAIDNKYFIQEKEVFDYIDGILLQIQAGNKELMQKKPVLLIDRSGSVNAYSIGGNIIAVNLGLVAFASGREEIALVIAHEIAHDLLGHAEKSMKERAEWLTSDEYKKSLHEVLDSRYERYSRLKKLMEGYTFSRTRHNRYSESEADSLAIILLRNSKISFDARYFLRLDSADMQYLTPLQKPVKEYFVSSNLPFDDNWTRKTTKGLSSRNYNFKKNEAIADSLKTHPDCSLRFQKTNHLSNSAIYITPVPASIKNKINKMIIWNIFDNKNLTACLYRIMQEYDKGGNDEWHQFMVHNVFAGLSYSNNQLDRFNAINVTSKEYVSQHYYELQTMLEQMPAEMLEQYQSKLNGENFWQRLPADAKTLKALFNTILDKNASPKAKEAAAKSFKTLHANSMYCEFAEHFISK